MVVECFRATLTSPVCGGLLSSMACRVQPASPGLVKNGAERYGETPKTMPGGPDPQCDV